MAERPRVLLTDGGYLDAAWPFVREALLAALGGDVDVEQVDASTTPLDALDWTDVRAVAHFGGDITPAMVAAAPHLAVVAAVADACPPPYWDALQERQIPFVDVTRAWAPSVAECGLALALAALRRIPYWHMRIATGFTQWEGAQFVDDPAFVNGDLGTKTVGVLGVGAIGGRLASWSAALGATVIATDPFAPADRFREIGATPVDIDELVDRAEVLFVAAPPTPSARRAISDGHVHRLRTGAIVVTITRAWAIDTDALRRRVLARELVWAADVFDIEPLPADDPIVGRDNVVHLPHIAGRTRDSNIRVAQLMAADIHRVLAGEAPICALTRSAAAIRTGDADDERGY